LVYLVWFTVGDHMSEVWGLWRDPEFLKKMRIDRIVIRCTPTTKQMFKRVAAELNAETYEEALLKLINMYEKVKKLQVFETESVKVY